MTKTNPAPTPAPRTRACMCGCGATPAGRRSRFMPGHDARLRGTLIRAAAAAETDATQPERDESAADLAALPDSKWAATWLTKAHGG